MEEVESGRIEAIGLDWAWVSLVSAFSTTHFNFWVKVWPAARVKRETSPTVEDKVKYRNQVTAARAAQCVDSKKASKKMLW